MPLRDDPKRTFEAANSATVTSSPPGHAPQHSRQPMRAAVAVASLPRDFRASMAQRGCPNGPALSGRRTFGLTADRSLVARVDACTSRWATTTDSAATPSHLGYSLSSTRRYPVRPEARAGEVVAARVGAGLDCPAPAVMLGLLG